MFRGRGRRKRNATSKQRRSKGKRKGNAKAKQRQRQRHPPHPHGKCTTSGRPSALPCLNRQGVSIGICLAIHRHMPGYPQAYASGYPAICLGMLVIWSNTSRYVKTLPMRPRSAACLPEALAINPSRGRRFVDVQRCPSKNSCVYGVRRGQ